MDTRRRLARYRTAVAAIAVLASGWALWLMRDRPALASAVGLFCVALLLIGLRRPAVHAVGVLQVDDLGRAFWRPSQLPAQGPSTTAILVETAAQGMAVRQWQRSERSAWLRLMPPSVESMPGAKAAPIDLSLYASDASVESWAALQRWLVWLERGQSR